jgi:uncharacterized radical SAM superfamily protein
MEALDELVTRSRELSWSRLGKRIAFYHPGRFDHRGRLGKYPAISVTEGCELGCEHCGGKLLAPMIQAVTPGALVEVCKRIDREGDSGCLLSGGYTLRGTIPWLDFAPAIRQVKEETGLVVTVHTGMLDRETASALADAGVDQALTDVIGDDGTIEKVFHGAFTVQDTIDTLACLKDTGIPTVPHIVVGLDDGRIAGEYRAIDIIREHSPDGLVFVSFMPLRSTGMENVTPPGAGDIARIMATARIAMPDVPMALGCARQRSNTDIDRLAVECGINRIALPSDEAMRRAEELDIEVEWSMTCCSVPVDK